MFSVPQPIRSWLHSRLAVADDIEAGQRTTYRFTWKAFFTYKRARFLLVLLFVFLAAKFLLAYTPPLSLPNIHSAAHRHPQFNWSQFAYGQYATDETYLCNSLMIFESLHRLDSKPDRILMYPHDWSTQGPLLDSKGQLLVKARDEYHVKLRPISVLQKSSDVTWGSSFTKLLAFNQTDYQRVLSLDSDSTILQVIFVPSLFCCTMCLIDILRFV